MSAAGAAAAARTRVAILALSAGALWPSTAHAWLFEEHANIGRLATSRLLTPAQASALAKLWREALSSDPASGRLCPTDPTQTFPTHDRKSNCVDFGALPAAAGDHSCSPSDLWTTVTRAPWFPAVYADAADTERDIHRDGVSANGKVDGWHQGNLDLQLDDPHYLDRAKQNVAHFVLARADEDTVEDFLKRVASAGTPLNATESYAVYHLSALAAAARYASEGDGSSGRGARALAVLTSEAFALHFLEDSFSAGHLVGANPSDLGALPERAGTHDYYCEHGLAARSWDSKTVYPAHGDAFQTDRDLAVTAAAVARSLGHVLDTAAGAPLPPGVDPDADTSLAASDVCAAPTVSVAQAVVVQRGSGALAEVLGETPQPYRADVALPHFRNEFGGFLRASGATRIGGALAGAIGPVTNTDVPRFQSALQVGAGIGVGAEGLTTHSTDGVFYFEGQLIAYATDAYAAGSCGTPCRGAPTRIGWGVRAHIPFYLVPGDTIATAVAWPFFPDAYVSLVLRAAQGSLWWRFERLHSGPTVSWQIVAGREAALFFSSSQLPGQDFEMTELELPLLEVRTKHLFSERLGEEVSLQLGGTLQWTTLDSSHRTFAPSVFARLAFDGIVYVVP